MSQVGAAILGRGRGQSGAQGPKLSEAAGEWNERKEVGNRMGTHQSLGGHERIPLSNRAFCLILRQRLWFCIKISSGVGGRMGAGRLKVEKPWP